MVFSRIALLLIGTAMAWLGFPLFAVVCLLVVWLLVLIVFLIRDRKSAPLQKALVTSAFLIFGLVLGVALSLIAFVLGPA